MPRRRPGTLLELEVAILSACLDAGQGGSHGFALAKAMADHGDTRKLTATGTMYRALRRLGEAGLAKPTSRRPARDLDDERRRYYAITPLGRKVAAAEATRMAKLVDSARAIDLIQGLKGI